MADVIVNPLRHLAVFNPDIWTGRIDVIGAGATGSKVVPELAKLGCTNTHVWDFDVVESHNIPNQGFGLADIGKPKVEALKSLVRAQTGIEIITHNEKVDGTQRMGEVIFLLTDSMSSRKGIFQAGIKNKLYVKLMIETRMGDFDGRIYVINPTKRVQVEEYEKTLYSDEVAVASACGTRTTVGATASFIASAAVTVFVRYFGIKHLGADDSLENETIMCLKPFFIQTRKFGEE